jgi:hypothetical protein
MNTRIRELAEQAGLDIIFHLDEMGVDGEAELWKFADLIVQECAKINYNSPFQDGEFHAREVLEHFGVEE